jgi:hypothetical protein
MQQAISTRPARIWLHCDIVDLSLAESQGNGRPGSARPDWRGTRGFRPPTIVAHANPGNVFLAPALRQSTIACRYLSTDRAKSSMVREAQAAMPQQFHGLGR